VHYERGIDISTPELILHSISQSTGFRQSNIYLEITRALLSVIELNSRNHIQDIVAYSNASPVVVITLRLPGIVFIYILQRLNPSWKGVKVILYVRRCLQTRPLLKGNVRIKQVGKTVIIHIN
jgi:hypothetical protein